MRLKYIYIHLCLVVTMLALAKTPAVFAAWPEVQTYDARDHYTKTDYRVPMRDGTKLYTAVYSPKDTSKDYPILLYRTPYSIKGYGEDFIPLERMAPSFDFVRSGYIFVFQDLRGTYASEGEFEVIRPVRTDPDDPTSFDESTDNYDTIEWLLNNIGNHNGKVGQWGISYSGWTTAMGMVEPHPALAASSPQASPADMFIGDDWHHNGAFRLMYSFSWKASAAQKRDKLTTSKPIPFDYGTPWGYEFFLNAGPTSQLNEKYFDGKLTAWNDFIKHPHYDAFWQQQNILPHMQNIKHPVLNVAAWFDAEDFYGPISIYQEIEKTTPENQSTLVVGPWRHGGWRDPQVTSLGDIDFGSETARFYQDKIVFPFFEHHLKGRTEWHSPEAIVFETGNNQWHQFAAWPPKNVSPRKLYFRAQGVLGFKSAEEEGGFDSYLSDPGKPVPYSTDITTKAGHTWMIEDQRQVSTRPDVLTYQTDVLEEDITIAGPITANLFVSTTGTDADYFVKLIDVLPGDTPDNSEGVKMGSYQMLVGVEVMRAKYRENMSEPTPLIPNEVTPVSFIIWDKFHTFKKGHRIMVQVHSSWFPAYDRNPQQFMDIYSATENDYSMETQRLHRSSLFPSHLELSVLPPSPSSIVQGASSNE